MFSDACAQFDEECGVLGESAGRRGSADWLYCHAQAPVHGLRSMRSDKRRENE